MTILKKHFTFGTPQCIQSDFNPLRTNVPHHIETSQLICNANQLTGFYMRENIGPSWVNELLKNIIFKTSVASFFV